MSIKPTKIKLDNKLGAINIGKDVIQQLDDIRADYLHIGIRMSYDLAMRIYCYRLQRIDKTQFPKFFPADFDLASMEQKVFESKKLECYKL